MQHRPSYYSTSSLTRFILCLVLVIPILVSLTGCLDQLGDRSPTGPDSGLGALPNYAQEEGTSTVVEVNGQEHEIHFIISPWGVFPYEYWIYAEINEQLGVGKEPGIDQVPVSLGDVVFTFSDLPDEVTEVVAAIKDKPSDGEEAEDEEIEGDQYTEIGRYAVENGGVQIAVAREHLIAYFGDTHYSVWFKVIGGENGEGIDRGSLLTMNGSLADGQGVSLTLSVETAFGTEGSSQPAAGGGPATVFFQGFETDTSGWEPYNGSVTQTASGTGGITSAAGGFHAVLGSPANGGPFTRFGGYHDTWPEGGFTASLDIYLDTGWAAGEGFDYSVAANGSDGNHQRDFIFHVTKDTSTGDLLVGGSNNSNFTPREDLENINHYVVSSSGWYTFQHVFYDNGGSLAVDLNLLDSSGTVLFTETRSTAADTIPGEVGGNRYGWFTFIDVSGGIAIDNTSLAGSW
ncbi:hypothetical protein GF339_23805 [candidate division KSB3 bacterium]|uniref:Uncharacterized protein n=1 Tax=candidate division KSB3 bacterium TaxID=2044937 RepID=A0A9D5Q869_9BACT|nr:hypothetical protein [candidate division KSB3 bacterium]MBD3327629.1 hypothetical protein [candidate division KSB3 bacterium]